MIFDLNSDDLFQFWIVIVMELGTGIFNNTADYVNRSTPIYTIKSDFITQW